MTPEQVEVQVIELIHREPFQPFVVEMTDGQLMPPSRHSGDIVRFVHSGSSS